MTELERDTFRAAMTAHIATASHAELLVTLDDLEDALAPRAGACSQLVRQAIYGMRQALQIGWRREGVA